MSGGRGVMLILGGLAATLLVIAIVSGWQGANRLRGQGEGMGEVEEAGISFFVLPPLHRVIPALNWDPVSGSAAAYASNYGVYWVSGRARDDEWGEDRACGCGSVPYCVQARRNAPCQTTPSSLIRTAGHPSPTRDAHL